MKKLFVYSKFTLFFIFLPWSVSWAINMPDYCPIKEGSTYTYINEHGSTKTMRIISVSDFLQMPISNQFTSVSSFLGHVGFYDAEHQSFNIYDWDERGFSELHQCEWDDDEIEELTFSQQRTILPKELEEGQSYSFDFDGFETQDGSRYRRRSGNVNVMFLGIENVSVEAGDFQNCVKVQSVTNERYDYVSGRVKEKRETCTKWYAYGIGLVKEECNEVETEDGETETEYSSLRLSSYSGPLGQSSLNHSSQIAATAIVNDELNINVSSIEYKGMFYSCIFNYLGDLKWTLDLSSISIATSSSGSVVLDPSDLSITFNPISYMDTNYVAKLKLIDIEHLIWELEEIHLFR